MSGLERLKSALESFARGSASAEQRGTVRTAIESGQVTLATGERAIAVGGNAKGVAFVTGDNNVLLTVSASTAEAVKQAIASLFRPSPNQLPADLPDFRGRQEQIDTLTAVLTGGGTAAVTAIDGMGGGASQRSRCTSPTGSPMPRRTGGSSSIWAAPLLSRSPRLP